MPRASAALVPTFGIEVTGFDNTNRPLSVFEKLHAHWSGTQPEPRNAAVTAGGVVGNGSSCTATLATLDPTTSNPPFYVGGALTTAGMANAAANETRRTITARTANSLTYSCTFNGTTDGGTVSSARQPEPATGGSYTDGPTGATVKVVMKQADCPSGLCFHDYSSIKFINAAGTYQLIFSNVYNFIVWSPVTASVVLYDNGSLRDGRWSRTDSDVYYGLSGCTLRKQIISQGTSGTTNGQSNLIALAGYGKCEVQEGDLILANDGHELYPVVGCSLANCAQGTTRELFYVDVTASPATKSAAYGIGTAGFDNFRITRSKRLVINYDTSCSPSCINDVTDPRKGIVVVNANMTFSHVLHDGILHGDVGVSKEGDEVYIGDRSYEGSPCNGGPGFPMINVTTKAQTCIWDTNLASYTGGQSGDLDGHFSVDERTPWALLSIYNHDTEVAEAALSATWFTTVVKRGAYAACELSSAANRRCWVLPSPHAAWIGGSYRATGKASWRLLEAGAPAGSVPKQYAFTCNWRNGSTEADQQICVATIR